MNVETVRSPIIGAPLDLGPGPARRRHGPVGDPLRGSRGAARRVSATRVATGQRRDAGRRGDRAASTSARASSRRSYDTCERIAARVAEATERGARCRSCSAATTRSRSARSAAWPPSHGAGRRALDRRARRPQHAGDEPDRERPRDAARRRARPRRPEWFESDGLAAAGGRPDAGRARRHPLARRRRAQAAPRGGRPRLHDERDRPDRDRARDAGGARQGRRRRASSTSRSTWTSLDPRSRRASARRCAAASPTARRTSRCELVAESGIARLARGRRGEPDPRPREHDGADRGRARRERARRRRSSETLVAARERRLGSDAGQRRARRRRDVGLDRLRRTSSRSVAGVVLVECCDRRRSSVHRECRASSPSTRRSCGTAHVSGTSSMRAKLETGVRHQRCVARSGSAEPERPGSVRVPGAPSASRHQHAVRPPIVQGFSSALAQTASTTRPPGRRTRAISASATDGLGNEHEPEAAEHAVDAASAQLERRGVLGHELDVREPQLRGRDAPPRLDHLRARRRSRSARRPAGADALGREEPGVARAGRELEHGVARLRIEQLDEPLREAAASLAQKKLAPPLPAGCDAPPGLDLRPPRAPSYAVRPRHARTAG